MTTPWPLGLYCHVPYCVAKCPYCDFASRAVARDRVPGERYGAALVAELAQWRRRLAGDPRPLASLYFGGGTPSLLEPATIARVLEGVRNHWPLDEGCEITLEANPESVTAETLTGYRAAGVTRLSIGVQSLDDQRLSHLGRPHDTATARRAVALARRAGFTNLSLDLIYATPGHDPERWRRELQEAAALGVEHLSCYALTVEPHTPLHRQVAAGTITLPGEGEQLELFLTTRATLTALGYPPYEISNFAPPGRECRHNLLYWEFGDYLGVGAGAHGKLTGAGNRLRRFANAPDGEAYLAALEADDPPPGEEWQPTPGEAAAEALMMGLRLQAGMARATYAALAGADLLSLRGGAVERLVTGGLLEVTAERVRLTAGGTAVANGVMRELI